ncbi:MAG: hypothetical protein JWN15_857 [Firmicutes bacterium]|nr:hypothetical protein [Bacillota bacterium]
MQGAVPGRCLSKICQQDTEFYNQAQIVNVYKLVEDC